MDNYASSDNHKEQEKPHVPDFSIIGFDFRDDWYEVRVSFSRQGKPKFTVHESLDRSFGMSIAEMTKVDVPKTSSAIGANPSSSKSEVAA